MPRSWRSRVRTVVTALGCARRLSGSISRSQRRPEAGRALRSRQRAWRRLPQRISSPWRHLQPGARVGRSCPADRRTLPSHRTADLGTSGGTLVARMSWHVARNPHAAVLVGDGSARGRRRLSNRRAERRISDVTCREGGEAMQRIAGKLVVGLISVSGMGLLAAACGGEKRSGGEAQTPGGAQGEAPVPVGSAVDSIVAARCDREARCNNIGQDREYSSKDACSNKIRSEWRDELTFGECPGGIDAKQLNECLEGIRNEGCGNPFDTLGRVVACRSSDLCRDAR
uniref:Uncharacterized protein n=1 Tax=Sorangium cellulosum TaxID=56 RepID=D2X902_SORCE|nr:hypothetical protein [Sorangium cellulosum]